MTSPRNAAVYARISSDTEGDQLGVTRQESDCRRFCKRRGWKVHRIYVDNDTSAYSGRRRPAYLEMLDDLKDGRVNAVVCWHPDRLHRSPRELEDFIDLIESTRATVASVTAGDYDLETPEGRLTARIVGSVARKESEDKSRRMRRKHLELAQSGRLHGGGTRAFGFESDFVTVKRDEAKLIVEAARRVAAGEALRSICADWMERGIETVTGRPWRTIVLRRVLTAPRVAGLREHQGEVIADAGWKPILDRPTWEKVRNILMDPGRTTWRPGPARRYLLTGFAHCGVCGEKLVARPRSDGRRCYVCASGVDFSGCGKIRVLADPLEELIAEAVVLRVASPELGRALAKLDNRQDAHELGAVVAADEEKLAELARDWADDRITRAEWLVARDGIQTRLDAARRELGRATRTDVLTGLGHSQSAVRKAWGEMALDRQRAVVGAVVDQVVVRAAVRGRNRFDDERIDLVWRV